MQYGNAMFCAVAFELSNDLFMPSSFFFLLLIKAHDNMTFKFTLTDLSTKADTNYIYSDEDVKKESCDMAFFLIYYLIKLKE